MIVWSKACFWAEDNTHWRFMSIDLIYSIKAGEISLFDAIILYETSLDCVTYPHHYVLCKITESTTEKVHATHMLRVRRYANAYRNIWM